ncbi:Crp/Fnr family transcriptional regulator [Clostridium ihumii]|uniref:Crp/Fnr family transcriptional regulator n=1 Tax=Clostridium ihumii TaxID=1470356 RepID=UPI00058EFA39|nr:Crp/Fnr family transcriptional regulator [Clostridium ihumii]
MNKDEYIEYLTKYFPVWENLLQSEKEFLLNNIKLVKYNKGENIHNGKNDCIGVLILKKGMLRTYILSEEGKEVTLYRLYKGDVCILSASCILKNITFDVHIDSEEDSEVLMINANAFSKIVSNNIYVENFSYKSAVDKFSDVMWAMEQILFMSFDKRLASFLISEMDKNKKEIIKLTHEQISKYIGSAREVVTRMLKYFASENIVELSRGEIKVIDTEKLKKIIEK